MNKTTTKSKKKILLATLLPISSAILIGGGITTAITLNSCKPKTNDPTNYVGRLDATD
jgi:hypothetical protein